MKQFKELLGCLNALDCEDDKDKEQAIRLMIVSRKWEMIYDYTFGVYLIEAMNNLCHTIAELDLS